MHSHSEKAFLET